ncbi:MAG: A/G-specific adenine glycosylase [Planctomycetota bacterium]
MPTPPADPPPATDAARPLIEWFLSAARDLPWRERTTHATPSGRDPYRALVAEVMLQQTQVSRVVEKLGPFFEAFPTVRALASATEAEVMAQWSGLGYYRRGKNLHRCAQAVVEHHDGEVPADAGSLRDLPGIGAYTAGAISSIVFGHPEPTVDGNITRVLLRLDGIDHAHGSPAAAGYAWERSAELVRTTDRPGELNEAMMELGAMVCTPKSPSCAECPLNDICVAHRTGRAEAIPRPKVRAKKKEVFAWVVHAVAGDRVLVRTRPAKGLWAGLSECPTIETEADDRPAVLDAVESCDGATVRTGTTFAFATTHRAVTFRVSEVRAHGAAVGTLADMFDGEWLDRGEALARGLSSPQRRIIEGGHGSEVGLFS